MAISNTAQEAQHELVREVETIESILARDHEPAEVQAKVTELFNALERGDILRKSEIEIAILYHVRNRVQALLGHESLQSDEHVETRNLLEKIRHMLHPLQHIARLYKYKPAPEQAEKINLGIDWNAMDPEAMFGDLPSRFDQVDHTYPGAQKHEAEGRVLYTRIPLIRSQLKAKQEGLELVGQKIDDRVRDEVTFGVGIIDTKKDVSPASFRFYNAKRDGYEEWGMKHREVLEAYRNQGIASKVIQLFNVFLKKRAKETGVPQVITANTGQADLLFLLIQEGFQPASKEDERAVARLFKGDDSLIIASGPEIAGRARPQWYIFDKNEHCDASGNVRPDIWESYEKRPEEFLQKSFRIRLRTPEMKLHGLTAVVSA